MGKDAGFVISHVHGNNCCGVVHVGEFAVPSTLEMTYVMAPAGGCASDLPIRIPLDKPNIDWRDEIEDPVLPAADGASLVAKRSPVQRKQLTDAAALVSEVAENLADGPAREFFSLLR